MSAIVIRTKPVDELNATNLKQKGCVFLKIHIGLEIKGKMFGTNIFEFVGLCVKNSSVYFAHPKCDQVCTS